jgi:uncharacterized protein YbdZ (MbtH family)
MKAVPSGALSVSGGDKAVAEKVQQTDSIEYIDYDWSLNRPENFPEFQ